MILLCVKEKERRGMTISCSKKYMPLHIVLYILTINPRSGKSDDINSGLIINDHDIDFRYNYIDL